VITSKVADLAVTAGKIGALAVTSAKIGTSQVITSKIADLNVTMGKLAATARRRDMVLRMEGVAASDALLGGNSTTGFTFVSSVRVCNARLVWNGSTSGANMRLTLYKNASAICILGTTQTPGKKWFGASSTSAQMSANTLQSTDYLRAVVTTLTNVKVSVGPPVLRIQYEVLV